MNKSEQRRYLRAQRDKLDTTWVGQASRKITWRLLQHKAIQRASVVACYLSHGNEVATDELIASLQAIGKTVAAPRITNRLEGQMDMARVESLNHQITTDHGLRQPPPDAPLWRHPDAGDVCIVPGVAFTEPGERLGMGGGFYDRWLSRYPCVTAISLAFESQIVEALPTEPHDVAMHWIVTEQRVIDCREASRA